MSKTNKIESKGYLIFIALLFTISLILNLFGCVLYFIQTGNNVPLWALILNIVCVGISAVCIKENVDKIKNLNKLESVDEAV